MPYKISGTTSQSGTVYVVQNKVYKGYRDVEAGNYEVIFSADDGDDVLSVCEDVDGDAIAYGGVTAISTASGTNIIAPSSGAVIKSIQRGVITISSSTYASATISSVDTTQSVLRFLGFACNQAGAASYQLPWIALINSTTVSAYMAISTSVDVGWELVEYESGIKSIQRASISIPSGPLFVDHTVSNVDVNKSFLDCHGWVGGAGTIAYYLTHFELINATTIRVGRKKAGTPASVRFQLVEFE